MGESGDDMPKFLNGRQAVVRSLLILLSTLSACQTRYQCRMRAPVFNNCNVLTTTAAKTESAALNLVSAVYSAKPDLWCRRCAGVGKGLLGGGSRPLRLRCAAGGARHDFWRPQDGVFSVQCL